MQSQDEIFWPSKSGENPLLSTGKEQAEGGRESDDANSTFVFIFKYF